MPYTPPSQRSPIVSRPETPSLSRSQSHLNTHALSDGATDASARPSLPRSTSSLSYLSRHRRTPSISKAANTGAPSTVPDGTSEVNGPAEALGVKKENETTSNGDSHNLPPLLNRALILAGAVTSPPDSSQTSSDDETNPRKRRGRELENLAELQAAIRIIQQHRESSPNGLSDESRKARMALDLVVPQLGAVSNGTDLLLANNRPGKPLTKEARKISHSRSSTEDSILLDLGGKTTESPIRTSDDSDAEDVEDDDLRIKPPLLRKKSGELVKPALRPTSARRRPSSMPGTPTYSKAVHFDNHLEHVRTFLQVERPAAVSAGSSPVESYESELEFPFGFPDGLRSQGPPFEWEISASNFPRETLQRRTKPVRVERVFLSSDNKNLIGTVAVANISFHKLVVARFTLDYWKTTSEVVAEYTNDVRKKQVNDGYDRFNFSIKLADQANLENKTLFFCVRYNVNGQEFWDNNDHINFQVDFTKKAKPQNGKSGVQGFGARTSNALPRSRPSPSTSSARPKSMPVSFDDFSCGFGSKFDFDAYRQPASKLLGESPPSKIRLRDSTPVDDGSTKPPTTRQNPGGQGFGHRYSFGASLSAAIQTANTTLDDRSGPKTKAEAKKNPKRSVDDDSVLSRGPSADPKSSIAGGPDSPNHGVVTAPSLQSTSYNELLDKYCFYGSAKSSSKPANVTPNVTPKQTDGAADHISVSEHKSSGTTAGALEGASLEKRASAAEATQSISQDNTAQISRSPSPAQMTRSPLDSRTSSPVSFGYPYLQNIHAGFETHTPTAIRG
ncbi:MAG: hypothetical protein M1835_005762 [Candelina submexicana]|nr:MAG: hypothetical protein M1835_005762 [Candelina submexicana]